LEMNKMATTWNKWIIWNTPWNILNPKKLSEMSTNELNVKVREDFENWLFSI
jgi:hypothetical protein